MRGTDLKLAGSIYRRPNGKRTVVTAPTVDPATGEDRRTSLGTFDTEEEAQAALLRYNLLGQESERRTTSKTEDTRLAEYLERWLRDVLHIEAVTGRISPSTRQDYEQVVHNHISPDLGHLRIGDLDPARLRQWLLKLRSRGLSDRTVAKIHGVLHRAMADADDLPTNKAVGRHEAVGPRSAVVARWQGWSEERTLGIETRGRWERERREAIPDSADCRGVDCLCRGHPGGGRRWGVGHPCR